MASGLENNGIVKMIFGLFKNFENEAAIAINKEFKLFDKLLKNKKGNISESDFKKTFNKKEFFRKVKDEIDGFAYEFAVCVNDDYNPFWFYGHIKKKKIIAFDFSCDDENFYNIQGGRYCSFGVGIWENTKWVSVINIGGIGKYGGALSLKKKLIKDYKFKDEKKGPLDKGNHL